MKIIDRTAYFPVLLILGPTFGLLAQPPFPATNPMPVLFLVIALPSFVTSSVLSLVALLLRALIASFTAAAFIACLSASFALHDSFGV